VKFAEVTPEQEGQMLALSGAIVNACVAAKLSNGHVLEALIHGTARATVGSLPPNATETAVARLAEKLGKALKRQIISDHKYLRDRRRK
jgi:hypothetical protein